MRYAIAIALLGAVLSFACALTPNQAHVQPDYPPPAPLGAPRDAGRE